MATGYKRKPAPDREVAVPIEVGMLVGDIARALRGHRVFPDLYNGEVGVVVSGDPVKGLPEGVEVKNGIFFTVEEARQLARLLAASSGREMQ